MADTNEQPMLPGRLFVELTVDNIKEDTISVSIEDEPGRRTYLRSLTSSLSKLQKAANDSLTNMVEAKKNAVSTGLEQNKVPINEEESPGHEPNQKKTKLEARHVMGPT